MDTVEELEDYSETELTGQDLIIQWNDCLTNLIHDANQRGDVQWANFLVRQFIK